MTRIHVATRAQIDQLAAANHVTPTRSATAASVTVGDAVYWWVAA